MSENRKSSYKFGSKNADSRRKNRQETSVALRKNAREEQMLKRRNVCMEDVHTSPLKEQNIQTRPNDYILSIKEIVSGVNVDNEEKNYEATQSARKMLSRERNPPIDDVINSGILPRLVQFLSRDSNRKLQFEAAWALTNIASGASNQTRSVVEHGAVPSFVRLLSCGVPEVVEQAIWALGNIAGDGPNFRDLVLGAGIVKPMMALTRDPNMVNKETNQPSAQFLQNISWTMSNLCRNKSPPTEMKYIEEILPWLTTMLGFNDKQIKADTCWAFSYITDGPNERIQYVLDSGVMSKVVELLHQSGDVMILTPALRTAGNIVTGSDSQTEAMISLGLLNVFPKLLRHNKPNIVKEAAWTISNITAGTVNQIEKVLQLGLLGDLVNVLNHGEFKAKKEATWAVTNLTSGGKPHQMMKLIELGVIEPLISMLGCNDIKIVQVILDGITNILNMADAQGCTDPITVRLEEAGAIDAIEILQEHENNDVYNAAFNIIDTWFKDEGDDEVPNDPSQFNFVPPAAQASQPFSF
jgi:importin subunit alpha-2